MGLDPNNLPDPLLTKIADPKEKRRLGKAGLTTEEGLAKRQKEDENELRERIEGFCRRNKIDPDGGNPAKRSRLRTGRPDLVLTKNNRCLWVEFKVRNNKLTSDQYEHIAWLRQCGNYTELIENYPDGIRTITQWFELTPEPIE